MNNKKILIVCLMISLIIIVVLLSIMKYEIIKKEQDKTAIMGVCIDSTINYTEEKSVKYINIMLLNSFEGDMPVSTISSSIKNIFTIKMPEYLEKMREYTDDEIEEYYKENKTEVNEELKIFSDEDLKNAIKILRNIKSDMSVDYYSCEFEEEEDWLIVTWTYENEENIQFKLMGSSVSNIYIKFD